METKELEEVKVDLGEKKKKALILYNDDHNTFDHVIDSLVKVCKHELMQAEQCTWIVHYNGKCNVKNGSFEKLRPLKQALSERGLTAKIH